MTPVRANHRDGAAIADLNETTNPFDAQRRCIMADTASKEVPATYVGTSKVAQTEYPVRLTSIGPMTDRIADLEVAHRQ